LDPAPYENFPVPEQRFQQYLLTPCFFSLQQFSILLDIKKKLIILWDIDFLRYGYFSNLSGKIFFFD